MLKLLLLFLLLPLAANATLVQGPDGAYNVYETGSGYNIMGVTRQGTPWSETMEAIQLLQRLMASRHLYTGLTRA